ncbi:uncharacterized protein [Euwallacea fornicatus]|uniref:uncharacterized protein n=1 Tax=Euwallacea fornicatus TaxID=995702 RepID=UPI00338FF13D
MFALPNFCRVCLKYDKNLIDLAHIENEPNETLMSKLQLCVSEVEWTAFKPLLCHPCIKRLNIAYSFKKQCVQSAGVLKNYVELVKESQKKNESQTPAKPESVVGQGGAYMLLPNQKYVKILVGSQNQGTTGNNVNSYQNVFLNLIPTTTISPVPQVSDSGSKKVKDTNQNVFLNINNTFQKFIPISPVDPPPLKLHKKPRESVLKNNVNVSELLTESNAEEMSVEIDPTSFLSLEHDDPSESEDELKHDWDEVITKQKVDMVKAKVNGVGTVISNGKETQTNSANFVPILPKDDLYSGGHFLSTAQDRADINCESCQRSFPTLRMLKQHLKQFHLGKLPFKCGYCYTEYLIRSEYEDCINRHRKDQDSQNSSLTLKDFADGNSSFEGDALSVSLITETPADVNLEPNANGDYVCTVCKRMFNSSAGLLRHRVRKHNQKNRKKYFIKGMKNAKCDICNREFSTQSYMQLHRKLHMREDGGYKYKVQGRSKYKNIPGEEGEQGDKDENAKEGDTEANKEISSEVVEPEKEDTEEETESDTEAKPARKRRKISSKTSVSSNEEDIKKAQHEDQGSESSSDSESNSDEHNDKN